MQTRRRDDVTRDLEAQRHRRFIKTHTPLDALPFDARVTYLHVARDPRDVAMSWDDHMANMDLDRLVEARLAAVGADDLEELGITAPPPPPPEDPAERFWRWIEGDPGTVDGSGLETLVHHVATFWERRDEPNVHLFHYRDLRVDLRREMGRLAPNLGTAAPTDDLLAAATFEAMQARADGLVPCSDTPLWRDKGRRRAATLRRCAAVVRARGPGAMAARWVARHDRSGPMTQPRRAVPRWGAPRRRSRSHRSKRARSVV